MKTVKNLCIKPLVRHSCKICDNSHPKSDFPAAAFSTILNYLREVYKGRHILYNISIQNRTAWKENRL